MMAMLPVVVVGPFSGALVDRWNRRLVMMAADSTIAVLTVVLAYLFSTDLVQVWHIYAIVFARATAEGFHWPAMQASTSLMVPEKHLARIAGLNQTLWGAMGIVAPPLGALLLSLVPLHLVLTINTATALVAVLPLVFIAVPQPRRNPADRGRMTVWGDLREGLRYIRGWQGLFIVMLAAMLMNLASSPTYALMPLLVTKHFGGGVGELGAINSAFGLGMTWGGLALSAWGGFQRRILTSVMGLIVLGLGTFAVGLAPPSAFWLGLAGMFVAGAMNPMVQGPLFAIIQAKVAPDMQGRVLSLLGSMAAAMIPVGMIIAGPVADLLGVRIWYLIGGAVCFAIGGTSFLIPPVMHLEDHRPVLAAAEGRPASAAAAASDE